MPTIMKPAPLEASRRPVAIKLSESSKENKRKNKEVVVEEAAAALDPHEEALGAGRTLLFGSDASSGRKDFMEDRHVENAPLGPWGVFFAVYDGHGGTRCAEFAESRLHKVLHTKCKARPEKGPHLDALATAVKESFLQVDDAWMRQAEKKEMPDGTTAVVCTLSGKEGEPVNLLCANLGDSRAVLCRGGEAVRISRDHKPDLKDEKERIEKAGGKVLHYGGCMRVTHAESPPGVIKHFLSTSRSFGDMMMKTPLPIMTAEPEMHRIQLTKTDLFMVLACDGVWDVLDDQAVCDIASQHMGDPKAAAKAIIKEAYNTKSEDNITAVVVQFGWQLEAAPKLLKAYAKKNEDRRLQIEKEKKAALADLDEDDDMFA